MGHARADLPLTRQQLTALQFIADYQREHGYPPSLDELRKPLRLAHRSSVHAHLVALMEKGMIDWIIGAPRTLEITTRGRSELRRRNVAAQVRS